jgi:hypothetical protein
MDYPFELGITDIADAVITFTDRLSTLSGRIMWPAGADAGRAHVVLFPSDRTLWSVNGGASDRFRTVLTGTSGRFLFEGLRAGAYYVAAVREGPPGGARTDRLASLASRAVLVSIGERDVKQIDVVVSGSGR